MRLLLVAATPPELAPTLDWLRSRANQADRNVLTFARCEVEVLFTGVGLLATAYVLGRRMAATPLPQLAIQMGIAGAYHRETLAPGSVVSVNSEVLADLGAEDADGRLLTLRDIGFPPGPPYDDQGVLRPATEAPLPFPAVAGATVHRSTGTERTRQSRLASFPDIQVESMEGAAFFHACLLAGVSPLQLRGISNFAGERRREEWKVDLAIHNVNAALQQVLLPFVR